jgi:nucleotide-binding universal stress UspA family protein
MPFATIVVGVSSAPTSQIAGRRAFEIAEVTGATVHVLAAVEDAAVSNIEVGSERFKLSDIDATQSTIESFVRSLTPAVPWNVIVADAKPGDALVSVAKEVGGDLIVVGNVRMQGFGRLLGSVGNDVSHHAPAAC